MVAQLQYTPRICWQHMLNAYVAHKTSDISLSWGFVGWVGCAPWCTHFGSASGRCIWSTRRDAATDQVAPAEGAGPGLDPARYRPPTRDSSVRAVTALALLPGNLSEADKIGLLPVPKPSSSTDIGAGSTERTFRVCVSASEKFDRLLRVVGSTGHCNTALSLSAGVSNPKVFLGRWFRRNAILFRYD